MEDFNSFAKKAPFYDGAVKVKCKGCYNVHHAILIMQKMTPRKSQITCGAPCDGVKGPGAGCPGRALRGCTLSQTCCPLTLAGRGTGTRLRVESWLSCLEAGEDLEHCGLHKVPPSLAASPILPAGNSKEHSAMHFIQVSIGDYESPGLSSPFFP